MRQRVKRGSPRVAASRITAYVSETFHSTRNAAEVLGVDHTVLWRAMQGHTVRGPSAALCEALEAHSKKPMRYWRGRDEE